jgi:Phosphate transporter family
MKPKPIGAPVRGCCASAGGAIMLFAATYLGIPISTSHTVTGAVIGVGAARKVPAVRWNIAANIVIAGSLHSERTVNPAGYAKPEELDADRAINEHALDNAINDLSI